MIKNILQTIFILFIANNVLLSQDYDYNCFIHVDNEKKIIKPLKPRTHLKSAKTIERWETLPIYGGEAISAEHNPINWNIAYVGTRDAGVYKTTDGGNTWFPVREGLTFVPIRKLVIDPVDTSIIYAGTDFDGLWKSVNSGNSWQQTAYPGTNIVFNIVIHPENNQIIYAAEAGGIGLGIGKAYKSEDGGGTWETIENGLPKQDEYINGVFSLVMHPENYDTLYLGTNFEGVFKTVNGGQDWTEFNDSVPIAYDDSPDYFSTINALAICPEHPENPSALIDGSYFKYNGSYWEKYADYVGEPIFPSELFFLKGDSAKIFTTSQYSEDAGVTWERFNSLEDHYYLGFESITEPLPGCSALIGAAGKRKSVMISEDLGKNWKQSLNGITAENIYSVEIDKSKPSNIYAGAEEFFYFSKDSGKTWQESYYIECHGGVYCDTNYSFGQVSDIAIDNSNSNIVYVSGHNIYRSEDGGKSFEALESYGGGFLKMHPESKSKKIYTTHNGIRYSVDKGETWEDLNNGLPTELGDAVKVNSFALDPVDTNILWSGFWHFKGIYKSVDGGQSWVSKGLTEDNIVSAIAVHPVNNDTIFAGLGYGYASIFRSTDGGDTWVEVLDSISLPTDFAFDPRNPNQIYVATEGWGIFRSLDCGKNWEEYDNGIFYPLHYSIDISEGEEPFMITGTYGSGIYKINPELCQPVEITEQPEDKIICKNQSVTLSAKANGENIQYQWVHGEKNIGDNSSNLTLNNCTAKDEGVYYCKISNECGSVKSNKVNLQLGLDTVTLQFLDETLVTSTDNASYQWINCSSGSTIDGAASISYIPDASGEYAVIVSKNGCADTSACYQVTKTGISKNLSNQIRIYPNPVEAEISLEIVGEDFIIDKMEITVLNSLGELVYSEKRPFQRKVKLRLQLLPSGLYILKLKTGIEEIFHHKFIKE